MAGNLALILERHGASAEAMDVCRKALAHNPGDPTLGSVYASAGRASYVSLN